MWGYIILAIFIWIMYNFLVKFVLPIYNTTQQIKRQVNELKKKQETENHHQAPVTPETIQKEGEYIDFEEIKQ